MNEYIFDGSSERLDKYLSRITDYSRSHIQKMITEGFILINGKTSKCSYLLTNGDVITIKEYINNNDIRGEDIKLDIYYEDDDILIVNKESGMVVHPGAGNHNGTLVNALINHCSLSSIGGEARPGIVHRIDADTSGLLMIAKNDFAHNSLANQLKNKTTKRVYVALVYGVITEPSATIDAPIGRDKKNRKKMMVTAEGSKEAITHFKVIERYKNATLIECSLETGRTHQIRVHLSFIGHPLVNDLVYGTKKIIDPDFGQMLHAKVIGFVHPVTNKYMEFTSPVPQKFTEIVALFKNE